MPRTCPPGTVRYVVQSGDTYYRLAQRYGTTVPAIIAANPGVNFRNLQIGQELCIPEQPTFPPCPEGNYYRIRSGDTFYAIARRFNVSLDDLIEANPGVDPDNLFVGQVICIPVAVPPRECPAGSTAYTIRRGDTFYSIAQRLGTTVQALQNLNPGVDPNSLLVGQVICVPAAEPPTECPAGSTAYTIRRGDTFYSIAQRLGTTVQALQNLNPGVDPENLVVGQTICVPES